MDCGDSTPDIIDEPDEEFGLFNSLEDQEYGIDQHLDINGDTHPQAEPGLMEEQKINL